VLLSTVFAAQGTGGFLTAKPTERKTVLLRVLGVERLERLAEQARERLKVAKAALETAAARLVDERQRGGDAALLEERLEVFRSAQTLAEGHVVTAQELVEAAVEQVKRIELIQQSNAATLRTRADIDARIDEARAKLPDLEERIKNNRAVLDQADAIRRAGRGHSELECGARDARARDRDG
jgi:exonuclease SbcC